MKLPKKFWTIVAPLFIVAAWSVPTITLAQDFDINKGIVGNLGESCRTTGNCDFCDFLGMFVVLQKVILSLFAGLALIMILWATVGLITAAGNQEKITAGKKLITSTLLGIGIIFAGYFLVQILYSISVTPSQGEVAKSMAGPEDKRITCSSMGGVVRELCALTGGDPKSGSCYTGCPVGLTGQSQSPSTDTYPFNPASTQICCIPAALSETWWSTKLGCPVPKSEADKDYCKTHADNSPCKIMIGKNVDSGVCQNKQCVSNCSVQLKDSAKPDAQCQNYSQCKFSTLESCLADGANCKAGLCSGDKDRVCCRIK